jgi:protein TilB
MFQHLLQVFNKLSKQLHDELRADGIDPEEAALVEDDGLCYDSDGEIQDPGYIDPKDGEFKRPWCPATRILEHRENQRIEMCDILARWHLSTCHRRCVMLGRAHSPHCHDMHRPASCSDGAVQLWLRPRREQEEKKRVGRESDHRLFADQCRPTRRDAFPDLSDGPVYQKNEGEWEFTLDESLDGEAIELEVALSKHLDTSLVQVGLCSFVIAPAAQKQSSSMLNNVVVDVQVDLQPRWARMLIKGKLLQLRLPCDIRLDLASAQRAKITGHLLLRMPKENAKDSTLDLACIRQRPDRKQGADHLRQQIECAPDERS